MVFKKKDPNKGAQVRVNLDKNLNAKVERNKKKLGINSKENTVKKMIRDFPEEEKE